MANSLPIWQIPSGVRDVLPEEAWCRRRLENRLSSLFESWAYQEIIPPSLEYYEILKDESPEEQLFKIIDRSGRILALRPDLTTPIARMVATHLQGVSLPQRLYYFGNVFRYEDVQTGKQREFRQAGVELIGAAGTGADAEVIILGVEALKACGLTDFQVGIGQASLAHGLLQEAGIPKKEMGQVKNLLLRKDYVALQEKLEKVGLGAGGRRLITNTFSQRGSREILNRVRPLIDSPVLKGAVDNLEEVYESLEAAGLAGHVFFDMSILRDFDYYTGIVFEGYALGLGHPVCGGGRYDGLLGRFGWQVPATGFALGVERALAAAGRGKPPAAPDCILIGKNIPELFLEAARLREKGMVVEIDVGMKSKEEVEKRARRRGISRVIDAGEVKGHE
ncbi:MAG TPA: ATP phosphoribosyltransferase regulatory subunit [Clostridia bacterium]|nr:ATP phosphoribosyltransferase regulatory subunit [Clostridia bacterium]